MNESIDRAEALPDRVHWGPTPLAAVGDNMLIPNFHFASSALHIIPTMVGNSDGRKCSDAHSPVRGQGERAGKTVFSRGLSRGFCFFRGDTRVKSCPNAPETFVLRLL